MFLGQIPVEEVAKWLNAIDIMVFPSRYEGFPNVLIEWQMAGLPCVIADTITPDVKITDLVKFESLEDTPAKWASDIDSIELNDRNDKKYAKQIKEAGYDIKDNAKKLEDIYLYLINKK